MAIPRHNFRIAQCFTFSLTLAFAIAPSIAAGQDAEALAKQLANPISSLVSVPLQFNFDHDIGPGEDGERSTLNVQPVAPFSIGDDWNLISRTILPLIDQSDVFPGAGDQSGLGDTVQSLFFSPKAPTAGGWIWGAGPVFLLPTGTDDLLTAEQWGAGPTAVALRQEGPWTYGALTNHIWSVAGDDDRDDVNTTFLQPFLSYTTPAAWSFTLQAEGSHDWEHDDTSVPVGAFVGKVARIGRQMVQFTAGPRYYAAEFENGPKGWGARAVVTLLFPK
jgi:hypothetical protein